MGEKKKRCECFLDALLQLSLCTSLHNWASKATMTVHLCSENAQTVVLASKQQGKLHVLAPSWKTADCGQMISSWTLLITTSSWA